MFKKYSESENVYNAKNLSYATECGLTGGQWAVETKCHGSNFSFSISTKDNTIRMGKRTGIIGDNENFYGSQSVLAEHKEKVLALANHLKETKNASNVIIYGEICGGKYPHQSVEKQNGATLVQSGIFYGPKNYFYAFDILVSEEDKDGEYVEVLERNDLLEKFGFQLWAKPLFIGTLQECIDYPCLYPEKISEWLGLPPIEGNICEGNVIKNLGPVKRFPDGSRVLFKNKNDKWSEKQHPPKVKTEIVLSEEGTRLYNEILSYLNEQRLHNVLSKIGSEIKNNQFGLIMSNLSSDLWADFLKDNREGWENILPEEQKKISKSVGQSTATLIRSRFNDILDNKF